ncbi:MAG: hypothetical protein LBS65_05240 [Desulfovibrio sp.]|nr:hypothetical protein [Desulfovibrio sp.]
MGDIGVKSVSWHDDYKELPKVTKKALCYCIRMNADGGIGNIETLAPETVKRLRKYGKGTGTGGSFPAMNIVPLYRLDTKEQIKRLEEIEEDPSKVDPDELGAWRKRDNWEKKRAQFWHCIHDKAHELGKIVGSDNVVGALADITLNYGDIGAFKAALELYLFTRLGTKSNINDALALLFYKGGPEKAESDCGPNISVILDLADYSRFSYPVAHEETTKSVNAALHAAQAAKLVDIAASAGETDAFGAAYSKVGEPMPEVKLAGGFSVKLRAMFNAQKSQYKYGRIGDESFPITRDNRARLKSALEYVADDARKNKLWVNADEDEIIFVYPSPLPWADLNAVQVLGSNGVKTFEATAKAFAKNLSGLPLGQKPENMHVFSLRKMDKSRSKVVYSRSRTMDGFVDAANAWQSGCENIPQLPFKVVVPFPLDVPKILNKVWKQDGTIANGKKSAKRMQFYQGLELLLERQDENEIRRWTHALIHGVFGLVVHAGNQRSGLEDGLRKELAEICAALGLLLYKRGAKKECYMESTAYLTGQLLKTSDELHALYCKVKREGDVPPQLAGNSVFNAAADNPMQALSILCTRMTPYLAWAKQYSSKKEEEDGEENKKNVKLAGWYIDQYRRIADKLKETLGERSSAIRLDDFGKAQLFIGYLASLPKKSTDAGGNDKNANGNQEV